MRVGVFLGRRSCVVFSPPAWRGVDYCCASCWGLPLCLFLWLLRFSVACPAASYPLGVTQPFWLHLPVLLLRWSYVCWVCGVFRASLGFLPCVSYSSRSCGWRCVPCRRLPLGVSALFLTPSACPTAALVAYVGQQPFSSVIGAYPAPAGLLRFAGYTPCVRELP